MDILERMAILGNLLSSNAEKMTKTEAEKYKKFLEDDISQIPETKFTGVSDKVKKTIVNKNGKQPYPCSYSSKILPLES